MNESSIIATTDASDSMALEFLNLPPRARCECMASASLW